MRRVVLAVCTILCVPMMLSAQQKASPLAVDITRALVKNLFESNAVPYIQPMVTTLNATSNARFYDRAYVPSGTRNFYIKVSANGMLGVVQDKDKSYTPSLELGPHEDIQSQLGKYGSITGTIVDGKVVYGYKINPNYKDTLGLALLIMRELMRDAQDSMYLRLPGSAATLFGNQPDKRVYMPTKDQLITLLHSRPEYAQIGDGAKQLDTLLSSFMLAEYLTLPPGANMSTLIAAVPQIEIGSLYGTELLIRYVPSTEFDANVGKFSFWGLGLKHSISQYFPDRWFDLAVQGVYQGTSLTNSVGFTESKLEADATIWSANIQASKNFWSCVDAYVGLSYEKISVISTYTYVLPVEVQYGLGILEKPAPGEKPDATKGDNNPQTSVIEAQNTNMKFTIGASAYLGPVRLAVDYNFSQFNMVSFGLSYLFSISSPEPTL